MPIPPHLRRADRRRRARTQAAKPHRGLDIPSGLSVPFPARDERENDAVNRTAPDGTSYPAAAGGERPSRRAFMGVVAGLGAGLALSPDPEKVPLRKEKGETVGPIVVSTWPHGLAANRAAYDVLASGGPAIDAVERGVMVSELDPAVQSVGYGGLPNEEGTVELDAAIMDGRGRAGGVGSLQWIKTPIAVARKVMEETPHVLLVGDGALRFALRMGFKKENLLTDEAKKVWEEWRRQKKGPSPDEGHDTIGMVALDASGRMAASCTTSGLRWKMAGRVGDSPLVGCGLYCHDAAGGAAGTGIGELIIKVCGSFLAVENMRRGMSPQQAVEAVIERIFEDLGERSRQAAFVALSRKGEVGAASILPGFRYAVSRAGTHELLEARALATG